MANLLHRDAKFSAFIHACLAPLPEAELVDTALHRDIRRARDHAWHQASCRMNFWNAVREAATYTDPRLACYVGMSFGLPDRFEAADNYKKALAEVLVTPAPRKADLDWKRRKLQSWNSKTGWYLPIRPEEIEASIADDEAYFAARPTKRTHRRAD